MLLKFYVVYLLAALAEATLKDKLFVKNREKLVTKRMQSV